MEDRSLGDLLRHFRMRAQLTQKELSAVSDVSQRDISDLERGVRRFPYRYTVDQLAEALRLTEAEHASLVAAARRNTQATNLPAVPTMPTSPQVQQTGDIPDTPLPRETATDAAQPEPLDVDVPQPHQVEAMPSQRTLIWLSAAKKVTSPRGAWFYRAIPAVLVAMVLVGGVLRYDAVPRRQAAPLPPPAPESQQVLRVGLGRVCKLHLTARAEWRPA